MERLTIRIDNGLDEIYFNNPTDPEGLYNLIDLANIDMEKVARRLAEYEDTGLDPSEILDPVELAKIAIIQNRLQRAEADNAALREVVKDSLIAFEIALKEAQGEDWPEIRKLRDKCKQALATDSGAALLKELGQLRRVREAAKEVCGTAQPIYKHGESGLEVEEICRANTLKMEALAQSLKALAEAEKEEVL